MKKLEEYDKSKAKLAPGVVGIACGAQAPARKPKEKYDEKLPPLHFRGPVDGGHYRIRFKYTGLRAKRHPRTTQCFVERLLMPGTRSDVEPLPGCPPELQPKMQFVTKDVWTTVGMSAVTCCRGDAFEYEAGRKLALKKALSDEHNMARLGRSERPAAWAAYRARLPKPVDLRAEVARLSKYVAELEEHLSSAAAQLVERERDDAKKRRKK